MNGRWGWDMGLGGVGRDATISSQVVFESLVRLAQAPDGEAGRRVEAAEARAALDSFDWGDGQTTRGEVALAQRAYAALQRRRALTATGEKAFTDWFAAHQHAPAGGPSDDRAADVLFRLATFLRFDAGSAQGACFTAGEAHALLEAVGPRPGLGRLAELHALRTELAAQRTSPEALAVLEPWLRAHPMPAPSQPLAGALKSLLDGLLWVSETDRAVFAVDLGAAPVGGEQVTQALLRAVGEPADTAVEVRDFTTEFARLGTPADPADPHSVDTARRFAQVGQVLRQQLTDLHVYRVGQTALDVYVLGKDARGRWVGVSSGVVET